MIHLRRQTLYGPIICMLMVMINTRSRMAALGPPQLLSFIRLMQVNPSFGALFGALDWAGSVVASTMPSSLPSPRPRPPRTHNG